MTRTLSLIARTYRQDPRDFWLLSTLLTLFGTPVFVAVMAATPN